MTTTQLLNVAPLGETLRAGHCGPAVLHMLLRYYGIEKSPEELARVAGTTDALGTSGEAMTQALEDHGFRVALQDGSTFADIAAWLARGVPPIVDWFSSGSTPTETADGHYSLAVGLDEQSIYLRDPEIDEVRVLQRDDFTRVWFDFKDPEVTSWDRMVVRRLIAAEPAGLS